MECKYAFVQISIGCSTELIDTLWNVNSLANPKVRPWGYRINRYIMECKYSSSKLSNASVLELIDTLWNVNFCDFVHFLFHSRINRYIMECKSFGIRRLHATATVELIDTLWNVNVFWLDTSLIFCAN